MLLLEVGLGILKQGNKRSFYLQYTRTAVTFSRLNFSRKMRRLCKCSAKESTQTRIILWDTFNGTGAVGLEIMAGQRDHVRATVGFDRSNRWMLSGRLRF